MAGGGAGRGHLVGINVVLLAIHAKRQAENLWDTATTPNRFDPTCIGRANLSDESQVMGGTVLFAGAERQAISAAHSHRLTADRSELRHHLLIDSAGQHHERDITGLAIGDPQTIDEFAGFTQLFQSAGQSHTPAMHHRHLLFLRPSPTTTGTLPTTTTSLHTSPFT